MILPFAEAQDKWTVKLNNKLVLTATQEDTLANTYTISAADWRKTGCLEIRYKAADPDPWIRSFLLYDENDNQLLSKDSVNYTRITLSKLRKLFSGKKKLIIYSVIAPKNPMMMVKVRRVHLCTLLLP
jgi:hypothetical protein